MTDQLHVTVYPKGGEPPPIPAGIAVKSTPGGSPDEWSGAPDYVAPSPAGGTAGAPGADPWAGAPDYQPPQPKATRTVGSGEAAGAGAMDAITMGTLPAGVGAQEAGQTLVPKGEEDQQNEIDAAMPEGMIGRSLTGALKAWQGDPVAKDAYDRGRKAALEDQDLAKDQHPIAFLGGQLAAMLAGGVAGGPAAAGGTGARILGAAGRAALGGAAYGGGSSISEGNSPGQVAKDAAAGGAAGAVLGGVGGAVVETAGQAAKKVMSTVRGKTNPDREVGARVSTALTTDMQRNGGRAPFTTDELKAGVAAGNPPHVLDLGGEQTRGLAQSAAFASRGAKTALQDVIQPRAASQGYRVGQRIRNLRGRPYAHLDEEALTQMSRKANAPAYKAAYAAGDRQIWTPELERLTGAPAVESALRSAQTKWRNWAVRDGYGAMNPPFKIGNGGLVKSTGGKTPVYPNIQFWDYAARELQDEARAAPIGSQKAKLYNDLARDLKTELDKAVPEYGQARAVALQGFQSKEAHELGKELVTSTRPAKEVEAALAKLSPFDREIAARAFSAELAGKLENLSRAGDVGSTMSAIKQAFISSIPARQRIRAVLGNDGADELEALLRYEGVIQRSREILSGSDTARKLGEGAVAGGAVASLEALKEGDVEPKKFLALMVGGGLAHAALMKGAAKIDEDVARRVGEMLASPDPQVVLRAIQSIRTNPTIFNAFRRVSDAIAVVTTRDVGGRSAAAAAITGVQKLLGEGDGEEHHGQKDNLYDSIVQ